MNLSATVIPRVVASAGLTQREFAARLGTSESRLSAYVRGRTVPSAETLLRMYQIAREAATEGRGWPTAAQTAAHINEALERNADVWAFQLLLQARDRLDQLDDSERAEWAAVAPVFVDARWSLLFAGVVADRSRRRGWPVPRWAASLVPLPEPWTPLVPLQGGPGPLDDLNILVSRSDLETK